MSWKSPPDTLPPTVYVLLRVKNMINMCIAFVIRTVACLELLRATMGDITRSGKKNVNMCMKIALTKRAKVKPRLFSGKSAESKQNKT